MARERVIVSIGEALLIERGGEVEAGGLALSYAAAAAKTGNKGLAVSRIGQDAQGDQWLRIAQEKSINVQHVQTDPDLPTARLITRSIAGKATSSLTSNAAFDNLQWDFDLVDLAQRADAVFFGQFARRIAQTRSVIKQFLHECGSSGGAMRVFDLTNRASDTIERSEAWSGLDFCEALVSDERGLLALVPSAGGDVEAAMKEVLRSTGVQAIIVCTRQGDTQRMRAVTNSEAAELTEAIDAANHASAIVRIIAAMIDGQSLGASVRAAVG